jgi:uncharacterized protein YdeI (BOF family)
MKKIIILITFCIFSLNAMAQDDSKVQKPNQTNVKYCAKLKDGKIMVVQNKNELTIDVTLANGTTVKTDGTIIKTDGSQIILKNGECIDNSGNLINPKGTDKIPPK